MKKAFFVLLIFCLFLSSCGRGYGKPPKASSNNLSSKSTPEAAELTAKFPVLDEGLKALRTLFWGSHGWHLYSGGEYLFAAFGNYLVRYSIAENAVDSVIELDFPEGWWCSTLPSPEGEMVVVKAGNHPDYNAWTNRVLIDFEKKTTKTASDEFEFAESKTDSDSLYEVEMVRENEIDFYKLIALNKSLKDGEIRSIPSFAISLGASAIINENRMGFLIGASEEANGYLGYDKFVIIDINQDKVIQEHKINEWDGYGREYWNERFGEAS